MKNFCKLLIIILLLWIFGFLYFLNLISKKIDLDNLQTADAIIVLTGGEKRIPEGFTLLKAKKAEKLFITGVNDKVRSIKEINRLYNKLDDEDREKVELGHEAENTEENAQETKEWIEKNNIKSIILVTANYHMPRSLSEFKKAMPNIKITAYPVFPKKLNLDYWWKDSYTRMFLIKEYDKWIGRKIILLVT